MKVADNKCQWQYYDERIGWQTCNQPAEHIHHILGEGELLDNGEDSEHSTPLPLCKNHHVKNMGGEEYSHDSSMHPDTAKAYKEYGPWKRRTSHLEAITGRKATEPSPFVEMSKEHRRLRENGDRYITGTPEVDQFYIQHMKELEVRFIAETGEKKPQTKPHPEYDPTKKKHWWDFLD